MSAAAAPWSVKGIDPKAREIAKDLARRSGMTLGEWLNSMIMDEPEDEPGVATLPRRSPIPDPYDRRARSRRLDDAYGGPSLEVIADRLEAAERRSAEAIRSIEEAVAGLVRRIDRQEDNQSALHQRVDRVGSELRDGHQRLKQVEQAADEGQLSRVSQRLDEAQVQTQAALKALERSFATLDDRLRQNEARVEPEGEASRFERLAESLSRQVEGNRQEMMHRLDVAEVENRANRLERALASIGEQSQRAEQKSAQAVEAMGREILRIAQNLNTRVERVEAGEQIKALGEKLERDLGQHVQAIDQRLTESDALHARALAHLGGEITRISDRLNERIADSERRSADAIEDISRRMAEHSERVEHRDVVSSELADRMRQSEERTAQLLAEARETMQQRAPRAEPVVPPLADFPFITTATSAASAYQAPEPSAYEPGTYETGTYETGAYEAGSYEPAVAAPTAEAAPQLDPVDDSTAWSPAEAPQNDWRAAAFGSSGDRWSDDDLDGLLDAGPFPSIRDEAPAPSYEALDDRLEASDEVEDEVALKASSVFADPLEAELSAWVEARSREATTPTGFDQPISTPFGSVAERSDFGTLTAPLDEVTQTDISSEYEVAPEQETVSEFEDPSDYEEEPEYEAEVSLDDLLVSEDEVASEAIHSEDGSPTDSFEPAPTASSILDDLLDAPLTNSVEPTQAEAEDSLSLESRMSTREALEAARAAMADSEPAPRQGFGFKRKGGKSKLQERLDKQARGEGSNIRKAFGASVLAALVVGGGYGFLELSGNKDLMSSGAADKTPSSDGSGPTETLAAMALALPPTDATPSTDIAASEGAGLFDRAVELLDKGDDRGLEVLKRSADLGHAAAQLRLAGLYQDGGAGIEPDATEARNWARRAAEGGDARAMHFYAMQLYDGVGGSKNQAAALGWLKRAAEAGRVDSQYNVARLYEQGDVGVPKNPQEAFTWYMIAARRGDQQALAAVQRLTPATDAAIRRKARETADAFNVDPIA